MRYYLVIIVPKKIDLASKHFKKLGWVFILILILSSFRSQISLFRFLSVFFMFFQVKIGLSSKIFFSWFSSHHNNGQILDNNRWSVVYFFYKKNTQRFWIKYNFERKWSINISSMVVKGAGFGVHAQFQF